MRRLWLAAALALAGCGGGMGQEGSVLWRLTASDAEKAGYQDERTGNARILCAQNYSGEGYDACVRNATKY